MYLRSPLDPNPVIVSNDRLMGCTKAAENFFRAQGVGKNEKASMVKLANSAIRGGDR